MGCCGGKHILVAERRAQLESFDDVIEVQKAEYEAAIDVTAKAFSGTATQEGASDLHWAMGPQYADFENPKRMELARYTSEMLFLKYVKEGAVVIGRRDEAGALVAVVVFSRLRGYRSDPCEALTYGIVIAGMSKTAPAWLKKGLPSHMMRGFDHMGRAEGDFHRAHGRGPHYQIQIAAVDPAAQGQGHSSKLLRRVNELADAENVPCFLFTAGPEEQDKADKVKIYSRFGYEPVAQRTIADETGKTCTAYGMVRNYRKACIQ